MAEDNYKKEWKEVIKTIPKEYKPISMWGYFGYEILFSIPCIGIILILIFSFGGTKNVNLRNFARSYFCTTILLFVLLLVFGVFLLISGFSYSYFVKVAPSSLSSTVTASISKEVDAFKDLEITLSGMSPNISVTLSNESDDEFIKTIEFTVSKSSGIANGETIKIVVTDWDEDMADENGYVIKETSMDYLVENQAGYITSTSELTSEIKNTIKTSFIEKAKSKASEINWRAGYGNVSAIVYYLREYTDYKYVTVADDVEYDEDLTLSKSEVASLYLLTKKEDSGDDSINQLVGIVRLTYTSAASKTTYLWYATVVAENYSLDSDGNVSENAVYTIYLESGKDEEAAYEEYVNSEKNDYDVVNVGIN